MREFVRYLEGRGCQTHVVSCVDGHILVSHGTRRTIVPVGDAGNATPAPLRGLTGPWLVYPVRLTPDSDGQITVTFLDFPGVTYGRGRRDAMRRARAFVQDAIQIYQALGESVPAASPAPDDCPRVRVRLTDGRAADR